MATHSNNRFQFVEDEYHVQLIDHEEVLEN